MERDNQRVRDWLAADLRDGDDEADARFAAIFAAVPQLEPRPSFVGRAARAARRVVPGRKPSWRPAALRSWRPASAFAEASADRRSLWRRRLAGPGWILRAATAAALGVLALAVAYYLAAAIGSFLLTRLPQLMTGAAQAFVWLMVAVDSGLDLWSIVVRVGRALGSAVTTPEMTVGLILIEIVGGAALFALYRVLASEQEPDRGDSFQIVRRL